MAFLYLIFLCAMNSMSRSYICLNKLFSHTEKQAATHFHSHGLSIGNGVGCPSATRGYWAMQIRLPTISKYGKSGLPSSVLPTNSCRLSCPPLPDMEIVLPSSGLPNTFPWVVHGLHVGNWPCELGCPLLQAHYFQIWKQWAAQLCAAH